MKKLLLLGGSAQQVIAIETAKRLGCYTVLCDYLPDNPGQYHADRFYPVSTTDKEAVLALAREEKIDGVLAYASDPATPTAAYVAQTLGLPTSPFESVDILCNKEKFREFLKTHGFMTPKARGYADISQALSELDGFRFPLLIKPVDSSGSKGVSLIRDKGEFPQKAEAALAYSRCKRFLVEEYVQSAGYPLAGDGFSVDGQLVFWSFADDLFDLESANPLAPVAEAWPYSQPAAVQDRIRAEIQRLLTLLHMGTCAYNFEARVDEEGRVFLMEVAPRSGGNLIPDVTKLCTGVDMIEYAVKAALGQSCAGLRYRDAEGFWANYMVHSNQAGTLQEIWIEEDFKRRHLVRFSPIYQPGDPIAAFSGANGTVGTMILRFDSKQDMLDKLENFHRWVQVRVNPSLS